MRPVFVPLFQVLCTWESMTLPGWDTSPSQVKTLHWSVPNCSWVDWDNVGKVPCLRVQHTPSSGHSRVWTSDLWVTGLMPLTTESCAPHELKWTKIPLYNINQMILPIPVFPMFTFLPHLQGQDENLSIPFILLSTITWPPGTSWENKWTANIQQILVSFRPSILMACILCTCSSWSENDNLKNMKTITSGNSFFFTQ